MAKAGDIESILKSVATSELGDEMDEFLPSGSVIFDAVLSDGRGIPRKKFIQLSSESGLGKSTASLSICKSLCNKGFVCVYLDVEKGVNDSQIDGIGLRPFVDKQFFVYQITTFEEAEGILDKILVDDEKLALIIIDSITGLIPEKMLTGSVGAVEPGLQARYSSVFLTKYKGVLKRSGSKATLLFINQMRNKLNFMRGSTYEAAGGSAQKFYMDVRLMMASSQKLTKVTNTAEGRVDVPYGCDVSLWAEKNRYARPFIKGVMTILFGKGISNIAAYQRWLENKGYAKVGGGGWYTISFPGKEPEKVRGSVEFSKWVKQNLEMVKSEVNANGGFLLIQEEEE